MHKGFPHSEITGSKLDGSSPVLIAALHVLLRYVAPRHPLSAYFYPIPSSFENRNVTASNAVNRVRLGQTLL